MVLEGADLDLIRFAYVSQQNLKLKQFPLDLVQLHVGIVLELVWYGSLHDGSDYDTGPSLDIPLCGCSNLG